MYHVFFLYLYVWLGLPFSCFFLWGWGGGGGGEWNHFKYNINLCQASHTQYRTGEMSGTKQTMMYVKSCLDSLRKWGLWNWTLHWTLWVTSYYLSLVDCQCFHVRWPLWNLIMSSFKVKICLNIHVVCLVTQSLHNCPHMRVLPPPPPSLSLTYKHNALSPPLTLRHTLFTQFFISANYTVTGTEVPALPG